MDRSHENGRAGRRNQCQPIPRSAHQPEPAPGQPGPVTPAWQDPGGVQRHVPPPSGFRREAETGCCRRGTSCRAPQRQLPLADGFCGIEKRFVDVLGGQARVLSEDLVGRHSVRDHRHYRRNREAQPSDAWHPSHDIRVRSDALVGHVSMLAVAGVSGTIRELEQTEAYYAIRRNPAAISGPSTQQLQQKRHASYTLSQITPTRLGDGQPNRGKESLCTGSRAQAAIKRPLPRSEEASDLRT
jgi:hypothetical protein